MEKTIKISFSNLKIKTKFSFISFKPIFSFFNVKKRNEEKSLKIKDT